MMLKGAQKKMIVVKTGDSELFEEAYFVLRADGAREEGDMISEANRIIEGCGVPTSRGKKREKKFVLRIVDILVFAGGAVLGVFGACIFLLVI